jgi:hypothetical protein
MIKKALLATTALVLFTSASQAGPNWGEVLQDVAWALSAPQVVYVAQPGYCRPAPRVVYCRPAPRVVYVAQPVRRCYSQPVVVNSCNHRRPW